MVAIKQDMNAQEDIEDLTTRIEAETDEAILAGLNSEK
jgi:hypothetical protein